MRKQRPFILHTTRHSLWSWPRRSGLADLPPGGLAATAPDRNPIVNPEKKNLKHLESEQSHLDFAICREMQQCYPRPITPF
jgi:hypothetical protein